MILTDVILTGVILINVIMIISPDHKTPRPDCLAGVFHCQAFFAVLPHWSYYSVHRRDRMPDLSFC